MELLVTILLFVLIGGLIYYVAARLLPEPFPLVLLVVLVVVFLLWLVGGGETINLRR